MNDRFLGLQFNNATLGKGKIVKIENEFVTVKFDRSNDLKKIKLSCFAKRVKRGESYRDYFNRVRKNQLEVFCKNRSIQKLLHFTHLDNLKSILKNGLLSRDELEQKEINYHCNDMFRYDNHTDAVCCSVSLPNLFMLFKIANIQMKPYVILELDSRIIWEKECCFFMENAG